MMEYPPYEFLVDRMLGRLVAWLRICGYNTKSALEMEPSRDEDTKLIEQAKAEGRILLSRDRVLVDRAKKAEAQAVYLGSDDVKVQLEELMKHFTLHVEPDMARCTACNGLLREATPEDLRRIKKNSEVPEHLIEENMKFWVCERCHKIYWRGSHWRNILKTAEEVNSHR